METIPQPLNMLERFNRWIQDSIMVKLFSIGFLILILLIPTSWIGNMIAERQQRAESAMTEVADKWSGNQTIVGPVLIIPYRKQDIVDHGKDGKEIVERIARAFFLPDKLDINGSIKPEILHRGIFDAVVYESSLAVKSSFLQPDLESLSINEDQVLWKDATMVFGITDLRGISDNPTILIGGKSYLAEPSNKIGLVMNEIERQSDASYNDNRPTSQHETSGTGIIVKLGWKDAGAFTQDVSINLSLKGSRGLDFVPAGKTTQVKLTGPWANPSFEGEFLPSSREITEQDFSATWKVLHFNRPFSQQWSDGDQILSGADFGVNLLIPVDQYQKSMRTSKYGVLIILLTFMALFLVEITQKIRIHPFQYILVGAALTVYYTLLLSFSEQIGYNPAYVIASLATVMLVGLYSASFLKNTRLTILFSLLLVVFYAFIFVIILQQDFSLLFGSIGLFTMVAVLMYFSRKVNWYDNARESES